MNTTAFLATTCGLVWIVAIVVIVLFVHGATARPTPPPPASRDAEARP